MSCFREWYYIVMAMRFRKSVSLGKGARINVSKSGVGASFGAKGVRYSAHSSGRRTTSVGIPGTGLYHISSKGGGGHKLSSRSSGGMTETQQRRLLERYEKKNQLAEERRNRPLDKLKEQYASGKIDKSIFEKLATRDKEVTKDLIIFGRGSGVKLAERYVLGKLTKEEFENFKNELLGEPEIEKDTIVEGYKTVASTVNDFIEKARNSKSENQCNYCAKQKKILSPLYVVSDFKLCGKCRKEYNHIRKYNGYSGQYYSAEPSEIDPDIKNVLSMSILPDHILRYR